MIGLRASRPETRAKFFQLYHEALPRVLYDRLRFILEEQDWTHLSHTFWIKHGLVRLRLPTPAHGVCCAASAQGFKAIT